MRATFFALRQGKMSMRDYVQKTRHLVLSIVTNPIDVVSQVHDFIFGMREGMTRYCLTRAEPSALEAAFALALREDYTVASSYARALTPGARASAPEPMEIDAIEAESRSRSTSTARGPRFNNDNRPRDGRQLVGYHCRKSGHRTAVCRAPAPVLASAEVVGEADDMFPAALPKNGRDQAPYWLEWRSWSPRWQPDLLAPPPPPVLYPHVNATTTNGDSRLILISLHVAGAEQPEIDWLARSVRRRVGYDVSEVFTHLLVAPSRHVAVVDRTSTTQPSQRESDGPRCVECAASVIGPISNPPSGAREGLKKNPVEQWFPCENNAVEQRLPHGKNAVEQRLPHVKNAVEQLLPLENATVEQRLPFADDSVAQQDLKDTDMVETEVPCLEEGEMSSSETSASSSGSRRLKKSTRNRSGRRRLRRRSTAVGPSPSSEILNVVEYSEVRAIEVANPPSDAATITRLTVISCAT
ncbi:hypothetical protein PR003_g5886 [Phytophthora rubi]|uniref:Retrotransposon gag domain-containing protein n=1 Tax=Phytophthora rubi TaxID=129364 RepID=A0A6A3P7N9_9STRA|nr:hypothetical protein PR002_g432 [Phytophthora rubi]KAE9349452.1 hypothetical protein PR003_g5886 [Phytophthora rubi]